MKFGIIGYGVVGKATGKFIKEEGHSLTIFDSVDPGANWGWLASCDYLIICVPTPQGKDGNLNTSILDTVLANIVEDDWGIPVVIRSTVPVDYTMKARAKLSVPLIYWPEFLSEREPEDNKIVPPVGHCLVSDMGATLKFINELNIRNSQLIKAENAELIKLLSNTYGAVLVTLMNEFRQITESLGGCWETVRSGLLATGRVQEEYSHVPGHDGKFGWGGNCWPKDVSQVANYTDTDSIIKAAYSRNKLIDRG